MDEPKSYVATITFRAYNATPDHMRARLNRIITMHPTESLAIDGICVAELAPIIATSASVSATIPTAATPNATPPTTSTVVERMVEPGPDAESLEDGAKWAARELRALFEFIGRHGGGSLVVSIGEWRRLAKLEALLAERGGA